MVYDEGLTLSVEGVDYLIFIIIKTFVWKVFLSAAQLKRIRLTLHCSNGAVIYKVVMGQVVVVEELHEEFVVRNKGTSNERISKPLNRHREVVDTEQPIHIDLLLQELMLLSSLLAKDS